MKEADGQTCDGVSTKPNSAAHLRVLCNAKSAVDYGKKDDNAHECDAPP